jgi:hypothetical protein
MKLFGRMLALFLVALALLPGIAGADYVIGYDETKSLFSGQTMMSYDPGHGTQVEYIAPNGRTYLLYPGNKVIVHGSWKLARTDKPTIFNLCFKYPSNSYNPVTKQSGGAWECQIAGFYLRGIADHAKGDVLGLAKSSAVPFVLSRARTSLSALIGKLSH